MSTATEQALKLQLKDMERQLEGAHHAIAQCEATKINSPQDVYTIMAMDAEIAKIRAASVILPTHIISLKKALGIIPIEANET
jgi:hypothetical protein